MLIKAQWALIVLCLALSEIRAEETSVINLNAFMDVETIESLWPLKANSGMLLKNSLGHLVTRQEVILFDAEREEKITSTKILPQQRYNNIPMTISENNELFGCLFLNAGRGLYQLALFDKPERTHRKTINHHSPGGAFTLRFLQDENTLIVGGPYLTEYKKMLDLYDENTMTPSEESKIIFKNYFENNKAYTLCKYNTNLVIVDSADYIERSGENMLAFLRLIVNQVMDLDKNSNIYLIHASKNYTFRMYSPSFKLVNEFTGENDNFIPLPDRLTKREGERLRSTEGSHSVFYALYSIENYLVCSFYQNASGWDRPEGPYFYDVYSQSGKKEITGVSPYPFFGRGDSGMMYLYVKVESNSWLSDDEYYLVGVSIEELLSGKQVKQLVLNKIDAKKT